MGLFDLVGCQGQKKKRIVQLKKRNVFFAPRKKYENDMAGASKSTRISFHAAGWFYHVIRSLS